MVSKVDELPEELFIEILTLLKLGSGVSALIPCLLCCKRWHQATGPVLCREIVLREPNMAPFFSHFPESQGALVRTFAVSLEYPVENPDCQWWKDAFVGTRKSRRTKRWLACITGVLHCMSNLSTFSFNMIHNASKGITNLRIPRGTLTRMLLALPRTCVNLEFAVRGPQELDQRMPQPFCEVLAHILPRLHYLRLHVTPLCSDISGPMVLEQGEVRDAAHSSTHNPHYARIACNGRDCQMKSASDHLQELISSGSCA